MGRIMDLFRKYEEAPAQPSTQREPLPKPKRVMKYHDWEAFKPSGDEFCGFYSNLLNTAGGALVSGATGSGKSVVLNGILLSILGQYRPYSTGSKEECELYLCDPKIVEFRAYKSLPHVRKYASDYEAILSCLDAVDDVMMARYSEMARRGIKSWDGSRIFLFIDEMGDLMLTRKKAFLPRLTHLLNLCRAAGITLFLGSQSPSKATIPAVVQLNCTAKICLKCDTSIESRQVVGIRGAELLPAHGTAMVRTMFTNGIVKVKIPNCTEKQISNALGYIARQEVACIKEKVC